MAAKIVYQLFVWFASAWLGDSFAYSSFSWITATPPTPWRKTHRLHSPSSSAFKNAGKIRSRVTTIRLGFVDRSSKQSELRLTEQQKPLPPLSQTSSLMAVMNSIKSRLQAAKPRLLGDLPLSNTKKQRRRMDKKSPDGNRKLNAQLVQCPDARAVLSLLASTKGSLTTYGGGGKLNSVNFSTSLHRIARHLQFNGSDNNIKNSNSCNNDGNNRSKILSDPRFALLVCSASEALVQGEGQNCVVLDSANRPIAFGSREMSNMAWALTKLKIVPPQSAVAISLTREGTVERVSELSQKVRSLVYHVAKQRNNVNDGSISEEQSRVSAWIPALSELCGIVLDSISYKVVTQVPPEPDGHQDFRLQERANLLWALAASQRGQHDIATHIVSSLISGMKRRDDSSSKKSSRNSSIAWDTVGIELARPQEWSNSIWAIATAGFVNGPEELLLPFVASLMSSNEKELFLDKFKPQELSNTAWGVATMLSNRCKSTASSLVDNTLRAKDIEDRDRATALAALEILRHVARQVIERQGTEGQRVRFKTQELSNTAWAFATVGFGLSSSAGSSSTNNNSNSVRDYLILPSDSPEEDRILLHEAMSVIIAKSKSSIEYFRSQELNNIAWTMARLDLVDYELMSLIGRQMCDKRRFVSSQDIGTTLWAFANSEFYDKEAYRCIASRLKSEHAGRFKSQELSNTLWALATAEVIPDYIDAFDTTLLKEEMRPSPSEIEGDPVTGCFAIAAQELMRRPFEFKSQEIKDILWSFSKLDIRHPVLFKATAEHLIGSVADNNMGDAHRLEDFSPQGIGNLAWAFARQGQIGCEVIQRHDGATTICKSTGRLAVYTVGFVDFGETVLKELFRLMASVDLRVHDGLKKLKPQDLSNTVWAMAVYGLKHEDFLIVAAQQFVERLKCCLRGKRDSTTQFKGQEVANLVWGFATLNCSCPGMMTDIAPYVVDMCKDDQGQLTVASIARVLKRQEMANIAWACAVFGDYPPDLVKVLYKGIVGVGENPDPNYLCNVYGDEVIQGGAVMSIIYLQIARNLEEGTFACGLRLPPTFPSGWEMEDSKSSLGDNEFELRLSTSKIQRDVSDAFSRIGFPHVDEYVISMETLSQEYGIQVASLPKEILSFDIANVDSKIGIEVDGPAHFLSLLDRETGSSSPGSGPRVVNDKIEFMFGWSGDGQEVNGATALKLRLMEGLGWRVINIPFWEWHSLNANPALEEQYCRNVLAEL